MLIRCDKCQTRFKVTTSNTMGHKRLVYTVCPNCYHFIILEIKKD